MTRINTARGELRAPDGFLNASSRRRKIAPLDEVLAYKNRDVVQRFLDAYPIDRADAQEIFTELKRWLWLTTYQSTLGGRRRLVVTLPMAALDEMWHCFVLFTQDYVKFCFGLFGRFIHHQPVTVAEKTRTRRRMRDDPEALARSLARQMEWQYGFIAEVLGEQTLRKWYVELPAKYPLERLQRLNAQSAGIVRQE